MAGVTRTRTRFTIEESVEPIADFAPFRTATKREDGMWSAGSYTDTGVFNEFGYLPRWAPNDFGGNGLDLWMAVKASDYIVWSYDTPIAVAFSEHNPLWLKHQLRWPSHWLLPWSYSQTTSRHQDVVIRAWNLAWITRWHLPKIDPPTGSKRSPFGPPGSRTH